MMLLVGCESRTDLVNAQVITKLPPQGLLVPCDKPQIKATSPTITASEDVPKLKAALHNCSQQVEDYLNWRAQHEQTKRDEK